MNESCGSSNENYECKFFLQTAIYSLYDFG